MRKKKIKGLFFVILWLCVIFFFSHSNSSVSTMHTNIAISKLTKLSEHNMFFNFVLNKLTENYYLTYSIRKLAHLIIFFVLQIIVFTVMRMNKKSILSATICSMLVVITYAIFDEIHQYFVPGRSCQLKDVFIDTIGGSIGLIVSYIFIILKKIFLKIFNR